MSVGKKQSSSPSRQDAEKAVQEIEGGDNGGDVAVVQQKESGSRSGGKKAADQRRYSRCFSGLEISIGPGPLKDVDAGKLKDQIRKWARAVVVYARQLSFGSPRSSPRKSGDGDRPVQVWPRRRQERPSLGRAATVKALVAYKSTP